MVTAAARGTLVSRGKGPNELSEMRAWGKARTVRAEVLRYLLVEDRWMVAARGVRLQGVRIGGHLDLQVAELRCPLSLDSCYLDGPKPTLDFARVSLLEIKGCHLAGLAAESLDVSKDLDLGGSTFASSVCLEGAAIEGKVNCGDIRLEGKYCDGDALIGNRLKVGGDLILDKALAEAGAIKLIGADITGQLRCSGASLNGAGNDGGTLIADTIKVGGGMFLDKEFTAHGAIRLSGADISRMFSCSNAKLCGKDDHGCALHAVGMRVNGDMLLDNMFTDATAGAIQLDSADIAEKLSCRGAILNGADKEGNALTAFGVKVGTDLWLDDASSANGAIRLFRANIAGRLSCHGAQLNGKDKQGNTLYADSITVGGRVIIDGGFTAAGTVRLVGANIARRLRCHDAELNGKDKHGCALLADEITVAGSMTLIGIRTTHGAVHMASANITRDLLFENVYLNGTDKDENALVADSMKVGGDVKMYSGFIAAGAIRLPGAEIAGRLRCGGINLNGKDRQGRALLADGLTVRSGAWLGGLHSTRGAIRLISTNITGDLQCEGVRLQGADNDGRTLVADRIKVTGSVFLTVSRPRHGETGSLADGTISLRSASIGGSLELKPEKLATGNDAQGKPKVALDLAGAKIAQDLVWEPSQQVCGAVVLNDAEVGQLKDDLMLCPNGYWPSACTGLLRLDGFTYSRFSADQEAGLEKRLAWIGSTKNPVETRKKNSVETRKRVFTTQPYEQLATVYRRAGQDTEAREVAIARRRDLRRYGDLTPHRQLGNWLLDKSIRYGYRTSRAIVFWAILYAIAFLIFWIAQHQGNLIIATMQKASNSPPDAMHCTSNYPCFYPAAYAMDTVFPLINVRQATYWDTNGSAPWGLALEIFTWVSIVLGWALATLAVAGYTGLIRRD